MQLYKFDYRLANELDPELQKLRCRVNYHALRFTKPIQELGSRIVMRMRQMSKRFIAVHLRSVLLNHEELWKVEWVLGMFCMLDRTCV